MIFPQLSFILFFLVVCGPLLPVIGSEEILLKVLNDTFYNYDKNIRPAYGVRPVEVKVAIHIVAIPRVDTTSQEFTLDAYLQQIWNDQRLSFSKARVSNITLEPEYVRKAWIPDVHFVTDTGHNVINEQVVLKSNGEIQKSTRLTVTASCPMNLEEFPFDTVLCPLHIESFSGPVQHIQYVWAKSPLGTVNAVTIQKDATIGDFSVLRFRLKSNDTQAMSPGLGLHSRLTLEIQLKRIRNRYEYDFSIWTWIVIISLASLWIGNTKISVSLCTINLLAVLLLRNFQISRMQLPKWVTSNWLDCYARICSVFIFFIILGNLLELNMPEKLDSERDSDEKEAEVKEDEENRKDNQAEEDAKLCRNPEFQTKGQLDPLDQLLALKSKLEYSQQQFFTYVHLTLPYLRWILLVTFLLSHFIFWKSIPTDQPLVSD